jgi:hypothetical protein
MSRSYKKIIRNKPRYGKYKRYKKNLSNKRMRLVPVDKDFFPVKSNKIKYYFVDSRDINDWNFYYSFNLWMQNEWETYYRVTEINEGRHFRSGVSFLSKREKKRLEKGEPEKHSEWIEFKRCYLIK